MRNDGLFPEEQRIVEDQEGVAARFFLQQAYAHTVPIIFFSAHDSRWPEPPQIVGGSGVVVEFEGTPHVLTCAHVIREYEKRAATDPAVRLQIGGANIDLTKRLKDSDEILDLATIDVSDIDIRVLGVRNELPLMALRPSRWPPDPIARLGGLAIISGFPGGPTRSIDVQTRSVTSINHRFIDRVTDVGTDSFTIGFDRSKWVSEWDFAAPPEIVELDLGGLSGCPVFGTREVQSVLLLELIGIVLSQIPFEDGLLVRSVNRVRLNGEIIRTAVAD